MKWSEAIAGANQRLAIALGRSWSRSRSQLRWLLWGTRQGRSTQRTEALEGLGTPHAHVLGSNGAPIPGRLCLPGTRTQKAHTPGKAHGPSMARGPTRVPSSEREEVRALRPAPTNPPLSRACSGLHAYVAGTVLAPAPVLGLGRPRTRRTRQGPIAFPGLQEPREPRIGEGPGRALNTEEGPTRALTITFPGLQEPWEPCMVEGGLGTLCAQARPIALVTLRNTVFRLFRQKPAFLVFSQIQAALAYPSDGTVRNGVK